MHMQNCIWVCANTGHALVCADRICEACMSENTECLSRTEVRDDVHFPTDASESDTQHHARSICMHEFIMNSHVRSCMTECSELLSKTSESTNTTLHTQQKSMWAYTVSSNVFLYLCLSLSKCGGSMLETQKESSTHA